MNIITIVIYIKYLQNYIGVVHLIKNKLVDHTDTEILAKKYLCFNL